MIAFAGSIITMILSMVGVIVIAFAAGMTVFVVGRIKYKKIFDKDERDD